MDSAGNTLATARSLRLGASATSVRDTVSLNDPNDYYQVRLKQKSSIGLKLSGLSANANLDLLSQDGSLIKRSSNRGTQDELIKSKLSAGTYYVRAYSKGTANAEYKLTGTAIAIRSFNIQFDYRFDSNNWFTAERRALLDQASKVWEGIIQDEFANIPTGTQLFVRNPTTGAQENFNSDFEIDDLVVFVGTGQASGALALGGPSGIWASGSSLDTRYNGSKFQPWTGNISFNPDAEWFFDASPNTAGDIPNNTNDFLSVVVHELGHVLGIGSCSAFDNFITNGKFTGTNAKSCNSGSSIPLDPSGGHIKDSFVPTGQTGEAAMDPSLLMGSRKLPSTLDLALLNDIGYGVNYGKAVNNSQPVSSFRMQPLQAACGCQRCLMASQSIQSLSQQRPRGDRTAVIQSRKASGPQDSVINQILRLTNRQRRQAGLAPLTLNPTLANVAQRHSVDMATNDFMSHFGSDGSDLGERLGDRNYRFAWANENVAAGYGTAREVINLWLNSPPHRANLLSSNATELGVGYKFVGNDTGDFNYNHYWTLVFGRPLT